MVVMVPLEPHLTSGSDCSAFTAHSFLCSDSMQLDYWYQQIWALLLTLHVTVEVICLISYDADVDRTKAWHLLGLLAPP